MACITVEVDANLNQCMVNTLLTNLGEKNHIKESRLAINPINIDSYPHGSTAGTKQP